MQCNNILIKQLDLIWRGAGPTACAREINVGEVHAGRVRAQGAYDEIDRNVYSDGVDLGF